MNQLSPPSLKPSSANFSSGPCAKRPGWSVDALSSALVGRSHRSREGKERLHEVIAQSKEILGIPLDYHLAIVPASDTGAFEMAMWSLLGPLGIDVFYWDSFGKGWASDIKNELKLDDVRVFDAPFGHLPDLSKADFNRDIIFTWNGTTSGVCIPSGEFIDAKRAGLTFCDATSAVFAMQLPWEKLDVVTWSWQKALGGEAAHGMLLLSPRAVSRLESYQPSWPMPKIFRMLKKGKLNSALFEGSTINTPSLLAVEDCLDALAWVKSIGGAAAMVKRSDDNLKAVNSWVVAGEWAFLAQEEATRSSTAICMLPKHTYFLALSLEEQKNVITKTCFYLDEEGVAFDIKGYRDAPPSLRIWGGATVETSDIEALLPWIDWAFAKACAEAI